MPAIPSRPTRNRKDFSAGMSISWTLTRACSKPATATSTACPARRWATARSGSISIRPTLNFGVGDWLVGRYGNAPFKVYLSDSRDCTIKDVTMMRNGFAPLREDGGGGNHYLHCVWALGPRPAGATEDPLVTNAADGMHMIGSYPGPDIENCVFQGVFLDDCIAIHGGFTTIKAVDGQGADTGRRRRPRWSASPRAFPISKGFFGEATVTALKDNGDKTWTATLDKDLGVPAGAKLNNPLRDGAGYKIIGCRLGNTRSRGILAKADDGLIKNNVIEGCGQAAISLGPEYYWNEANYVTACHWSTATRSAGTASRPMAAARFSFTATAQSATRTSPFNDNRFVSNYQGDIDAQWTDGLTLTGNVLAGPASWPPGISPQSAMLLANSRNVTLKGNVVKNASAYKSPLLYAGPNLTDVVGNDSVRPPCRTSKASFVYHDGSLTDTNIRYIGRWDRSDPKTYHSYWGGAYLRANFTGTSSAFNGGATAGGPTFLVSLDGEPPHEVNTPEPVHGLKPGPHTLLLGRRTKTPKSSFGA